MWIGRVLHEGVSAVPKGRWGTWTHVYIADVLASICVQWTAVSIYQVKVSFESSGRGIVKELI